MKTLRCGEVGSIMLAAALLTGASACMSADSREPGDETPATEQEAATEAPAAESQRTVPQGTQMTFTVDQTVSTETHSKGDHFTATLRSDVSDVEGDPAVAAGTPSRWIVTESTTDDGQTLLAVALESIQVDGEWMPVTGTVSSADLEVDEADSNTETAAKISVGAAAGALIGQIIGSDTRSTLAGAGVGAAVGTAVALTTRGGSAKLPEGSRITVQLDEPLVVS